MESEFLPLLLQNVKANASICIDIGMVNLCVELNFGRLERVVRRKLDREEKNTALVWRVTGTHYRRLPIENVLADRPR